MNWIRGSTRGCPIWRDITGSGVGIVENIKELVGLSGMGKIQGVVDTAIGGYGILKCSSGKENAQESELSRSTYLRTSCTYVQQVLDNPLRTTMHILLLQERSEFIIKVL